ncbi:MAG: FAD-dependent oxidoreductase [Candidatus Sericytochromatia bacterium]
MLDTNYDVVIIGGGPAGATAALYTSRADLKTLVIDKNRKAGALGITSKIANWPGIIEIVGEDLVEKIQEHSKHYGAEYITTKVTGTFLTGEEKQIFLADGNMVSAKAVILATGSMGKSKMIDGEQELIGKGVSYCATCDAAFFRNREVAVLGSSEETVHEALFLTRFAKKVNLISPKANLDIPEEMEHELKENEKIEVLSRTNISKVLGENKVTGVQIRNADGSKDLAIDGLFIFTQGNKPIVDYLTDINMSGEGCIMVNSDMETSLKGVFACGDILCNKVQQAVVAASQGCIAALSADKYINRRDGVKKDYK